MVWWVWWGLVGWMRPQATHPPLPTFQTDRPNYYP